MSKVLLLNGSTHPHGCTATALEEMRRVFEEEGVEAELIQVGQRISADAFHAISAVKPENACSMIL